MRKVSLNKRISLYQKQVIRTAAELSEFREWLVAMRKDTDILSLLEDDILYCLKLGEKSFAIVYDDVFECDDEGRIGYVRVSTDTQQEKSTAVLSQAEGIKKYCQFKDYTLKALVFDLNISGDNRELLKAEIVKATSGVEMFRNIRPGLYYVLTNLNKYNKVLSIDPSRLWRDNDVTGSMIRILIEIKNGDFEFVNNPALTLYATDNAMILQNQINYVIADYERRTNNARIQTGRKNAALAGKCGMNSCRFGYRPNKNGYKEINKQEAEIVELAYAIWKQYKKPGKTAELLNRMGKLRRGKEWKPYQISDLVSPAAQQCYAGYLSYGNEKTWHEELVIIPEGSLSSL